ncbi:hypothetical protein T10_5964 [Trichinella papuae]|uniref:Uncharacterized protein n=1 Tax=Trichinella papuae TaxID=268474 RepID=A0A0V1M451_9BILA|nr:hypothetical protein T10_5964 [Trichinella papuae]
MFHFGMLRLDLNEEIPVCLCGKRLLLAFLAEMPPSEEVQMKQIILPRSGLLIALLPVQSLVQRVAQQSMHGQQYPTEIPHHINVGLHSSLIIIKCAGSYADEIFECVWIVGLIIRDGFRYAMEIPG